MPKLNMVAAINLALHQEMQKDNRVLVIGEDVGKDGGVFRVTEGLLDDAALARIRGEADAGRKPAMTWIANATSTSAAGRTSL